MMKIKNLVIAIAALAFVPVIASAEPENQQDKTDPTAQEKVKAKLTPDEVQAMAHVHHVNQQEIDLAKTAMKQGTPAIKSYAEMLQRDHGNSDKQLMKLTKQRGTGKIPAETPKTEIEKQERQQNMEAMNRLKKLKGAEFDREYLRMMVEGHEKELAKNDVFLASTQDPELKQILENRKTTLQRHADTARDLQNKGPQAKAPEATKSDAPKSGGY